MDEGCSNDAANEFGREKEQSADGRKCTGKDHAQDNLCFVRDKGGGKTCKALTAGLKSPPLMR